MKALSTIFYAIFVALIVAIAGLLLGTMLPIPGNIEVKIVKSGSMEPNIMTGSIVVVKPSTLYAPGDIITFGKDTKSEIPTTHRVMKINDDGTYTTKGDANEEEDTATVARGEVIGKVIVAVPYTGFVLDFARQPIGFALLIAVPAGLVILEEVLTIIHEARKWMRRRRGDDEDKEDEGGEGVVGFDKKVIYKKARVMDEIFAPSIVMKPRILRALSWEQKLGLNKDSYSISTPLTFGILFFGAIFSGHSGGTISYFQDIERSVGNILQAGVWVEKIAEIESDAPLSLLSVAEEGEESGEVLGEETNEDEKKEKDEKNNKEEEAIVETPVEDPTQPEPPAEALPPQEDAETESPEVAAPVEELVAGSDNSSPKQPVEENNAPPAETNIPAPQETEADSEPAPIAEEPPPSPEEIPAEPQPQETPPPAEAPAE